MSTTPRRSLPAFVPSPGSAAGAQPAPAPTTEPLPEPPVARRIPHVGTVHGHTWTDDYFWLRHREDPEVLAYLEAENRYTEAVTAPTEELRQRLFAEMRGRIKESDLSVPERIDGWLYYHRTETGAQYPIYCRCAAADGRTEGRKDGKTSTPAADGKTEGRKDGKTSTPDGVDGTGHGVPVLPSFRLSVLPSSSEQILLDLNPLAAGHEYFRLGGFEVSPDHRLLAWSADTTGAESFTLYVKDLETGALLSESIPNVSPSVAWANDSRTLFYVVLDQARRPCRLFRHRLGDQPSSDVLVHDETDESFFVDIGRTRSNAYLLLEMASHSTAEVRYLSADDPEGDFRVIEPRRCGIEYSVTHHGDRFYITTNDGGANFRLVSAPVTNPSREHWTEVLPHRPEVKLDSTDTFAHHLVAYEREGGLRQIRVMEVDGRTEGREDGRTGTPGSVPVTPGGVLVFPSFRPSVLPSTSITLICRSPPSRSYATR